jgi:hypothetical protein
MNGFKISEKSLPDGIYMDSEGELMLVEGRFFTAESSSGVATYDMWDLAIDRFVLLTVMLNNAEYLGEI